MITIRRDFTFAASHRLVDPTISEGENRKVYGKCFNWPSHGHTYTLEVYVTGEPRDYGMLINFSELDAIVKKHLIDGVDHQFLNDVPCLFGRPTTCELMVEAFWKILDKVFSRKDFRVSLEKLVLWETPKCCAIKRR